jgi:uncharacterized protein
LVRGRTRFGGSTRSGVGVTSFGETHIGPEVQRVADQSGPQRRCLVTGAVHDRETLLRFVVGPDGHLTPDIAIRLPGRGLWLTPRRDIVERAVMKRAFARAACRPLAIPEGLANQVEALLVQRCVDGVGIARRAGIAVCGFERVSEAASHGKVAVLLAALDGAQGARRKLEGLGRGAPLLRVLTAEELGAAFGREHVVNASIGSGPLSRRLLLDAQKLAGFRADAVVEQRDNTVPARGRQDSGIGAQ